MATATLQENAALRAQANEALFYAGNIHDQIDKIEAIATAGHAFANSGDEPNITVLRLFEQIGELASDARSRRELVRILTLSAGLEPAE